MSTTAITFFVFMSTRTFVEWRHLKSRDHAFSPKSGRHSGNCYGDQPGDYYGGQPGDHYTAKRRIGVLLRILETSSRIGVLLYRLSAV